VSLARSSLATGTQQLGTLRNADDVRKSEQPRGGEKRKNTSLKKDQCNVTGVLKREMANDVFLEGSDGKIFGTHWMALARCGTAYFKNLRISGEHSSDSSGNVSRIKVVGFSGETIDSFLTWLYGRSVPQASEMVFFNLYSLAECWDVVPLIGQLLVEGRRHFTEIDSVGAVKEAMLRSLKTGSVDLCELAVQKFCGLKKRYGYKFVEEELTKLRGKNQFIAGALAHFRIAEKARMTKFELPRKPVTNEDFELMNDSVLVPRSGEEIPFYKAHLMSVSKVAARRYKKQEKVRLQVDTNGECVNSLVQWLQVKVVPTKLSVLVDMHALARDLDIPELCVAVKDRLQKQRRMSGGDVTWLLNDYKKDDLLKLIYNWVLGIFRSC